MTTPLRLTAQTVFLFSGLALCTPTPTEPQEPGASIPCVVSNVVDGDTLDCADSRRVRLLLIDAPEMAQEPFGGLAHKALADLVPIGTAISLEIDVDPADRYGRTLAYVVLPDGRIVNEELLRNGAAVVAVYPPNVRHVERFRAAAQKAQQAGRDMWGLDGFRCLPDDFRSGLLGPVNTI